MMEKTYGDKPNLYEKGMIMASLQHKIADFKKFGPYELMGRREGYRASELTRSEKPSTLNPGCLKLHAEPGYVAPDFHEVNKLQQELDFTFEEISVLLGVSGRTVRSWLSDPENKNSSRSIPYSAWRLLLLHCGYVKL